MNEANLQVPAPLVVIAMDSFKGCIGSMEAAGVVADGLRAVWPQLDIRCLPVADGGEGTVEAMYHGLGGEWVTVTVTGPMGSPVEARYLRLPDGTAILELASASGLTLVPAEARNPLHATTYGTGELMRHALASGCTRLMLGVGGSATNDGGVGLLEALGARFLDENGETLRFGRAARDGETGCSTNGGGLLHRIARVDTSEWFTGRGSDSLPANQLLVACDVQNPLCGPNGASHVFGPQKGATPEMVRLLDENLRLYADVVRRQTGVDVATLPGSGAAGGVNASLVPFLHAELRPGIAWVLEAVGLRNALAEASLVITGEGRMDGQSVYGKAPIGVAAIAKEMGLPVCAIVGDTGDGVEAVYNHGIDRVLKLRKAGMTVETSMAQVRERLFAAGVNLARTCFTLTGTCQCKKEESGPQEA